MKALHKPHLWGWSMFNPERNLDFHSVLWQRPEGNVAIDPLPLSEHDQKHLEALGGVRDIFVTNSDHVRAAPQLAAALGARVWVPRLEHAAIAPAFGSLELWPVSDGDEPCNGLKALELNGSKTPGELALVIEEHTLCAGDLVRGHRAGRLNLLPDAKLKDKASALLSLGRLAALSDIEAVLVGDGWPVFRGGHEALQTLLQELSC